VTIPCALLLGTPVDDVTLDESIDAIAGMVADGRRTGRVHQIATVNVDFVVNAAADDELRRILRATDLSIPDGMGIVWGARVLGTPIRERSAGADLVPALAARAAREGWRICLFGGSSGVAVRAADVLRERAPGVDIVVVDAPQVGRDGAMDAAVVDALRDARADVVGVALGNPKQEHWIARHGTSIGAPVFIGIGGTLDFLTGATRRAPTWMQRAGLEWIHRAASEPRRLVGRYAHDLRVFGPALVRQAVRGRRRRGGGDVLIGPGSDGRDGSPAVATIDLVGLRRLDNRAAARIAMLRRDAARRGERAVVTGASGAVHADAGKLAVGELLDGR
jgi:N-acetylglucosaminyldiphosphoundecaprenol N-acetyl-beta-D-mannosaminyltransferase